MNTNGPQQGAVATQKAKSPAVAMRDFLETRRASFEELLPTKRAADRFMRILLSLPIMNPAILACAPESIIKAAILCARDGLEPDGRHAALIPFNDNKAGVKVATYVPMVHGWIRKAFETGEFVTISAHEVKEKDYFDYAYGLNEHLDHRPAEGERGETIKFYALYKLKSGGQDFVVMTMQDIRDWAEAHAQNAFKNKDSLFNTDIISWALKTVVKRLLHFAPTSIQMADDDDEGMRNVTPHPTFNLAEPKKEAAADLPPAQPSAQPEQKERKGPLGGIFNRDRKEGKLDVESGEREPGQEEEGQLELY